MNIGLTQPISNAFGCCVAQPTNPMGFWDQLFKRAPSLQSASSIKVENEVLQEVAFPIHLVSNFS